MPSKGDSDVTVVGGLYESAFGMTASETGEEKVVPYKALAPIYCGHLWIDEGAARGVGGHSR